jgi:hypothetical protein
MAQVERVLPVRGSSSLEGTSFVVGFMQNEVAEIDEDPRLQIFISAQFDATVTITSPIVGTYSRIVRANTVHVETMRSDHVVATSEVAQRKAVFITSDVPIVVYALNTLAQSTDSYTAIPIKHLGLNYRTVNRGTDRYAGQQYYNQLPRVGEFMVIAIEDNTVVTINTPVPTLRRQRAISTTLRKGDCYLVQALPTANGADDLTASEVVSSKPVALLSGHVRSSVPTVSSSPKDHLVEQLPPVEKWGKTYATAPMLLKATVQPPDVYRIVASVPNQDVQVQLQDRSFVWRSTQSRMWFDTLFREPVYWNSDQPFLLVQHMPSGGLNLVNFDPAMVVVTPIEQFVNSALFQFPTLEVNDNLIDQQFLYFLNVIAAPEALATLRIDTTRVTAISPQIASQIIPGTNLHWAQLELAGGSHVIRADSGLFSGVMYGTSAADSYANMVGVAYEPVRKKDLTPPAYALGVDCGSIFGEIRDQSRDTALLEQVYVVSAQTRNYRWTITPVADSAHVALFEAVVLDPLRDAQIVIHAYDNKGNGREWKYVYDAPTLAYPKTIVIDRNNNTPACTTVVVRNMDTTAARISTVYIVGDKRITVDPQISDTLLRAKDSLVLRICISPTQDTGTISAVLRVQLPCLYLTANIITRSAGTIQGSMVDFGNVRIGDTACTNLSVVNTGSKTITLTSIMLAQLGKGLTIDTTGLMLPRTMKPGDQVWIRACFVPVDTGDVARADSVFSNEAGTAALEARGRGVRPVIEPLVVDWGKRRLGSVNDTTVYLRNSGSCAAEVGLPVDAFRTPFRGMQASIVGARLGAGDSLALRLRYAPASRGAAVDAQVVAVDWRLHDMVRVELRGTGVLPDLVHYDVDMGSVQLGLQRDSVADLLDVGALNDAPLVVDSVKVMGPDASAFVLPVSLIGISRLNLASTITDIITFRPTKVGAHLCALEIYHNASASSPGRDTLYITGVGLPSDSAVIETELTADLEVVRCGKSVAKLDILNSGTARAVLRSVRLIVGADTTDLSKATEQRVVPPGALWSQSFVVSSANGTQIQVEVIVTDSAGNEYRVTRIIRIVESSAYVTLGWDLLPSASPLRLVTGEHAIILGVGILDTIDVQTAPRLEIDVPHERFTAGVSVASATLRIEGGMPSSRILTCSVVQSSTGISIAYPEVPRAPWECVMVVPGQVLWKNDRDFSTSARMSALPCIEQKQSQPIDIATVPCGSSVREVSFDALPRVAIRPLQLPFDDVVTLEVESTAEITVSVVVQTLSGQEFHIPKRFTLQKGIQHCNFSCSDWVAGTYRLIISNGSNILDRKIIIVN